MASRPEGIHTWTERSEGRSTATNPAGRSGQCFSGKPYSIDASIGRTSPHNRFSGAVAGALVLLYPFGKGTGIPAQWGLGGKVPILLGNTHYAITYGWYSFTRSSYPNPAGSLFLPQFCLVCGSCRGVDTLCHAGIKALGIGSVAIGISVIFHFGQDLDSESDMIQ